MYRIPPKEKKEMKAIPPEQIGTYLEQAKNEGALPMFYLELTTGLRRGELTALSRNRRSAELVDQIQDAFQLYEQSFLSEKSLWYRKRPGKRSKNALVFIDEATPAEAIRAQAEQLLHSEYGRAAIAAYVMDRLDSEGHCFSKDLGLKDDKAYIMSLLAVLTSGDKHAAHEIHEMGGLYTENGYTIPQMEIRRKGEKK